MPPTARDAHQRMKDTLRRLEHDVDAWVATADVSCAAPYLIPLSFLWDGASLLFATSTASPTIRNLRVTGKVRLTLGGTRDVVLVEGTTELVPVAELDAEPGDAFAAKAGFDPRPLRTPFHYFWVRPQRIQAWREENELVGRDLMRAGKWLDPTGR